MTEAVTDDQFDDMFENIETTITPEEEATDVAAPVTTAPVDDGLIITFGGEEFSIPNTQDLR